ncbi:MAG: DsbA family protein [Actinomycetota bacterium]|nr:DsbA family protein [Actinomycetota bacterium]
MSAWVPRAIIALVVAGVAISIVSISVGDGGPTSVEFEERGEVQGLVAGIKQDDARLGEEEAPVEIELFTDVRALPGATFQAEVIDPVIEEFVRGGRAQISLRHFSFGRAGVTEAAIAATAAGEQGHQWQFAEIVFRNLENAGPQGVDEAFLKGAAEVTPGLEIDEWDQEFAEELEAQSEDPSYANEIDADGELANELKLPVGPAVVITGIGGVETLESTPTLDEVRAAIERVDVGSADPIP